MKWTPQKNEHFTVIVRRYGHIARGAENVKCIKVYDNNHGNVVEIGGIDAEGSERKFPCEKFSFEKVKKG